MPRDNSTDENNDPNSNRELEGSRRNQGLAPDSDSANNTDRRGFMRGLGLGVLGTGIIGGLGFGAGVYTTERFYRGGNAENSTNTDPQGGPGIGNFSNGNSQNGNSQNGQNETQNETPVEPPGNETDPQNESGNQTPGNTTDDSPNNETDPDDGVDNPNEGTGIPDPDTDPVYTLDDQVEVDLDELDPVYEDSSVVMGVQEDGDLVAWNIDVENDDGYNPLWRFSSDQFPNPEFYDVDDHPIEMIYDELNADVESLSESMVNTFYDGDDWESESEYKEIAFEDLKNGLVEYSSPGPAQDYFFNRSETLNNEDAVLETEWQELLQDGL